MYPEKFWVVYQIYCIVSGKSYVGSTYDEFERWNSHLGLLRRNKHHSIKLQRAYNKYGEESFDFKICDLGIDTADIAVKEEAEWIKKLDSFNNGYNMTNASGAMSDSVIAKMRLKAQEIGQRPEVRKGRSERAKIQHAQGKITYRRIQLNKFKSCQHCKTLFPLKRNPKTGAWRENKLCDNCSFKCRFATRRNG